MPAAKRVRDEAGMELDGCDVHMRNGAMLVFCLARMDEDTRARHLRAGSSVSRRPRQGLDGRLTRPLGSSNLFRLLWFYVFAVTLVTPQRGAHAGLLCVYHGISHVFLHQWVLSCPGIPQYVRRSPNARAA